MLDNGTALTFMTPDLFLKGRSSMFTSRSTALSSPMRVTEVTPPPEYLTNSEYKD